MFSDTSDEIIFWIVMIVLILVLTLIGKGR